MCLAVPGRIMSIEIDIAKVDFGGVSQEANLTLVPEAKVGDYVLVHAGFAIQRLDEAEAEETLRLFQELAEAADREERETSERDRNRTGEGTSDDKAEANRRTENGKA
ncbi:HypC/HybG/HupF family hydrogenase formation chaperone [bacterium]|nr:HypC/HybG/HupF family hydrogenase formation chaperone [bacterium]